MPLYDYECDTCGARFEAQHGINEPMPPCPNGHHTVHRLITSAPRMLRGMAAPVSYRASKEELRDKWAEETPRLRKKLTDKLGEDTVRKLGGTLNHTYDE
ncbi:MAG: zinc ribbon domain-containing protein [Anaerolineae bacterium]|nr:zinc ribbon domain-containing protein [Anaerolineae bacterium]